MKKPLAILLLLFSFVAAQKKHVAVLDFDAANISAAEVRILADRLRTEVIKLGVFDLVERSIMEEVLKEQAFQQTGCVSDECAVEVGKLLGVEQMIAGSIGKLGSIFTISVRMIDVETGGIFVQHSIDCRCPIETVLTETMAQLAAILSDKTFVPTQTTTSSPAPVYGSATFTSILDSVTIFHYDPESVEKFEILGVTPITIEQQTPGIYTFAAIKDGYENFVGEYEITAGSNSTIPVLLESTYGSVSFTTSQNGVSIYRYDIVNEGVSELLGVIGDTSPLKLENQLRGSYYFIAQKDGYQDHSGSYQIIPRELEIVHIDLKSIYGSVNVTAYKSNESNTLIRGFDDEDSPISLEIDGQVVGTTPFYSDSLLFGSHDLVATAEGCREYSETFIVEGGSTRSINIALPKRTGTISVTPNHPRDSGIGMVRTRAFIDGDEMLIEKPATVREGNHTLLFQEYGYQDYTTEFFIRDGENLQFPNEGLLIQVPVRLQLSPSYASTIIRGKLGEDQPDISIPPETNPLLVFGEYEYTTTAPKHFPLTSEFSIDSNTPFNLEISLNPKSRSKTALYSLFVPGSGQFYAENTLRGLIFFTATVASGYLLYSTNATYLDDNSLLTQYERDYTSAVGLNDIDKTRSLYLSQVDQVNQLQIQLLNYGVALGTTWLLNLIDAVFFNGIPSK